MDLRKRLRESVKKDSSQQKGSIAHSKTYHRFFEGYSEIKVPNSNGKGYRIQRVYTGDYHRQDLTKPQRLLLRALYFVLYLVSLYLFVSSAVLPLASNSTWYVVITQVISIPFLFWILIVFISYLPVKQDLTIDEYRSSSIALQNATLGAAVGLGAAALVTLSFMFLNLSNEPLSELLCAVKYLAAGLLAFSMNRMEKRVNYLIIPNPNKPPADNEIEK